MYVPDIQTYNATTLAEAADLLTQHGPNIKILAGGTDLLVDLKAARLNPTPLVSIADIPELQGITNTPQGLRIGALTRINELNTSPLIKNQYAAIQDASREMAAYQIRNMATVGGNVAGAVPCADLPPILITMSGQVVIWNDGTERTVPIEDFIKAPRQTTLSPGEIVTAILVPTPNPNFAAAYARFALREGNAIAVASAACGITLDNNEYITDLRISLGAVGPTPINVNHAADLALGKQLHELDLDAIANEAATAAQPIGDIRGSIEYRRKLVGILTTRAIQSAHQRALQFKEGV